MERTDISEPEAIRAVSAYTIATCDRRLHLKGRKWEEIRRFAKGIAAPSGAQNTGNSRSGEADMPPTMPKTVPMSGWAILPDVQNSLADILHHCSLPLRLEPANAWLFHRGIASPGAKYAVDVRVNYPAIAGEAAWLRLDSHEAFLFDVPSSQHPSSSQSDVRLVLSGDLNKCLDPYGDMSANLVTLEAGMIAMQVSLFSAAFGWETQVRLIGDGPSARKTLGIAEPDLMPLIEIRMSGLSSDATDGLRRGVYAPSGRVPSRDFLSDFPLLERYTQACECDAARIDDCVLGQSQSAKWPGYSGDQLRQLCHHRTSGAQNGDGRPDEIWTESAISKLKNELTKTHGVGPSDGLMQHASVHLSFRLERKQIASFVWDPAAERLIQRPTMPEEFEAFNAMKSSLVATFGIDESAMIAEYGPRGHLAANVVVGMLTQRVTLAATALGWNTRPIGAFNARDANRLLSLDQRVFLQMKVNRSITPNPFLFI